MSDHVIKRAEIVQRTGQDALLIAFDALVSEIGDEGVLAPERRKKIEGEDEEISLVYPGGWQESDSKELLELSPRAFWLAAMRGLIPVTERGALQTILRAGMRIEKKRRPIANVRHLDVEKSTYLMRIMASGRTGRQWEGQLGVGMGSPPPIPKRIVEIGDESGLDEPEPFV